MKIIEKFKHNKIIILPLYSLATVKFEDKLNCSFSNIKSFTTQISVVMVCCYVTFSFCMQLILGQYSSLGFFRY